MVVGAVLRTNLKPRTEGEFGLPKRAVARIAVDITGVAGDFNNWRSSNLEGDPDQAVLVITEEVIRQLQAEGWPIAPGDLGENLTLDVPESALVPGARLTIGGAVLEISKACNPCSRLFKLPYVGQEAGPEFLKTTLGRRGWYARVVSAGTIESGAQVTVSRSSE